MTGKSKTKWLKFADMSVSRPPAIGVGVISQIDMIGSLCTLIARGAVISMVVVATVVPTLLLTFDSVIRRTTLGFKKGQ